MRTTSILWVSLLVASTATIGCVSAGSQNLDVTPDGPPQHALAAATLDSALIIVPSVEAVLGEGNILTWAEHGFEHFEAQRYEMAIPYFDASLASGQASTLQKAYLYWFKALSYRALEEPLAEARALELFVMTYESTTHEVQEALVLAGSDGTKLSGARARLESRARLFSLRLDRESQYGLTIGDAIVVDSLAEETLVLTGARCDDGGRFEILDQRSERHDSRRFDVVDVRCSTTGQRQELVFDLTSSLP